jgi:cob(I)alamin adenosyltransferase
MNAHYKDILAEIQDRLFTIGAILQLHHKKRVTTFAKLGILDSDVELLENEIDRMESDLHK